jgi:signal transduction histidine kinase
MKADSDLQGPDTSIFHRVSRLVNSELSLDEILGQILGLTAQVSDCDACLVYLMEFASGEFVLYASQVPRYRDLGKVRLKFGEGVTGWVAEHQQPVALSSQASTDPRFRSVPALIEDTYEALLSVPLVHKGKSIGVVNVHHREAHAHTAEEIASISFMGEQMGGAIAKSLLEEENARLAERDRKLEQDHILLEAEVARRTAELKATNEQLRSAKERAEEVSRLKSEFVGNMSHEIRTPLNGVVGMTDLLLDSELTDEQREYLTIVKQSASSLMVLINDILDFSKIEAGKLELDPTEFPVRQFVEHTARMMALAARQKGLNLVCEVAASVPATVVADESRVRQVVVNLLGNAIKFTERGEVVLSVEPRASAGGDGAMELRFAVRDTGIGIGPEKLEHIFEAFAQADGSTARRYGGTGLGLTISRRLVELMGGRISVESRLGQGSTFAFTVPSKARARQEAVGARR